MKRSVGNACNATLAKIIGAEHFSRARDRAFVKPIWRRGNGTPVPRKIDDDSVSAFYVVVVDEMAQKTLLDVVFSRVFVKEHADLLLGDAQIFSKPTLDFLRIVHAGLEVPDCASLDTKGIRGVLSTETETDLVLVDADDEAEDANVGLHKT